MDTKKAHVHLYQSSFCVSTTLSAHLFLCVLLCVVKGIRRNLDRVFVSFCNGLEPPKKISLYKKCIGSSVFADIKTKEYKTRPKQRGEDVAMYAALLKNRQRPIVGGADANASSLGAMRYDAKLKPFRGSIHTHRATWWKSSSRAAREIVALATVFLLTFYVSYSRTTTMTTTTYTPSQHGLEMRKYYAEQWKENKYRYLTHAGRHRLVEYSSSAKRKLLASYVTSDIEEVTPPETTCNSGSGSYVVSGADTAGDFGARMCCSSYYATKVEYCGYNATKPSFNYLIHVTSDKTSTASISSSATNLTDGDCKSYEPDAPAKICVYTECQTTDKSDCTFPDHKVTFTHSPFPSPPPPSPPPPAQAAVEATMELTGYNAAEFGDAQKTAFKNGMASYLNVDAAAITVTNVIDVASSGRKLQAATDKVSVEFTVKMTTFADISTVEEKLVTEDATKLNNIKNTLSAQADLTVTAITAPVSLTKLAPPPSPPPPVPPPVPPSNSGIISTSDAAKWSILFGPVVSLAFAVLCDAFLNV